MEDLKEIRRRAIELAEQLQLVEEVHDTGIGTVRQVRELTDEERHEHRELLASVDFFDERLIKIESWAKTVLELSHFLSDAYSPNQCKLLVIAAKRLLRDLRGFRTAMMVAGSKESVAFWAMKLGKHWEFANTIKFEDALSRHKRHCSKQVALGRRGRRWSAEEEEEATKRMHHRLKTNKTTKKDAALWVKGKMGLEVHVKTIQDAYRKRSQKGESAREN